MKNKEYIISLISKEIEEVEELKEREENATEGLQELIYQYDNELVFLKRLTKEIETNL